MFKLFASLAIMSIVNASAQLMNLEWDPHYYSQTKVNSPLCENAPILAYHIHTMVWPHVPRQVASAMKWQRDFIDHFGLAGKRNCTHDSADPAPEQQDVCAWPVDWQPVGPFNNAQLSFHVPKHHFNEVYEWALHNRGELDILFHPKTGCDVEDHTIWASWTGAPW